MNSDARLPVELRIRGARRAADGDAAELMRLRPRGPHDVVMPFRVELPHTPELQRLLDGAELDPETHKALMAQVGHAVQALPAFAAPVRHEPQP